MVAYQTTSQIAFVGWDRSEETVPIGTVYFPSEGIRVSPGSEPQQIQARERDYLSGGHKELVYGVSNTLMAVDISPDQTRELLASDPSTICSTVSQMKPKNFPRRGELPRLL